MQKRLILYLVIVFLFLYNVNSAIVSHSSSQINAGVFALGNYTFQNNLNVNGGLKIGLTSSCLPGTLRWNGTKYQGCNSTFQWSSIGGEGFFMPSTLNNIYYNLGNVGIGTTSSIDSKLKVNGNVDASSISISGVAKNSNWDAAYTHSQATSNVHGLTFTSEGSGGGLDADTLDGLDSSSFLSNTYLSGRSLSDANSAAGSGLTAYYLSSGASNKPSGNDHALFTQSYGNTWSTQMASDWRTNNWYVRNQNNGAWGSWANLWHSSNDGSGSGLDADTLDGVDSSSLITTSNIGSQTVNLANNIVAPVGTYKHLGSWAVGRTAEGAILVNTAYTADYASNLWNGVSAGYSYTSVNNDGGNGWPDYADSAPWSGISGRPSVPAMQDGSRYTTDFNTILSTGFYNAEGTPANSPVNYGQLIVARGVDTGLQIAGGHNSDNLFFRGWWSSGAGFGSWRTIWHNGNDGSGSGLDADTLDGYHTSGSTGVNTIPVRDANGYTYFNYINSNTGNDENPAISQVIVTNGADNFYRKASMQHLFNTFKNYDGSGSGLDADTLDGVDSSSFRWYDGWITSPGYDANTLAGSKSGFSYGNNAPYTGPLVHFDAGGYGMQLSSSCSGGGTGLAFRTRNGDTASWNSWYSILHSGNYNSYSPTLTGGGASGTWPIAISGNADYSTYARYIYDNGAYSGAAAYREASSMYVYYASLGRQVYDNGVYSGTAAWREPSAMYVAYANSAGNSNACSNDGTCDMAVASANNYDVVAGEGNGLKFWSDNNYKIHMGNSAEYHYGPVTDYSIKTNMNNQAGRGWTWGINGLTPVASIEATTGSMQIAGNLKIGQSSTTCNATYRGQMRYVESASGVDDVIYACMKSAANTYNWVMVARGS